MTSRMRRARSLLLLATALVLTAAGSAYATTVLQTEVTSAGKPVVRETLAGSRNPGGAPNHTLYLQRATLKPGARLATERRHTRIAYVAQGKLSVRVARGHIDVSRGAPDNRGRPPHSRQYRAGAQVTIRAGEWFEESHVTLEWARNTGSKPTKILFAALFPFGRAAEPAPPMQLPPWLPWKR